MYVVTAASSSSRRASTLAASCTPGDAHRSTSGLQLDPEALLELLRPPSSARTLEPQQGHVVRHGRSRYAEAALGAEAAAVRSSGIGTRNDTLNRAAFNLSRFVLSGELQAVDVWSSLMDAARAAGLLETEAERTISSAFGARATR